MDKSSLYNLPEEPGVYLMKDRHGKIIYVGKAKILKNRVKQYFTGIENHTPKVRAMVSNIDSFEYIITDSEIEALILECNLIKTHKPYYNILLKDDKHYPYIRVSIRDEYPKIQLTRKLIKDGARYYGPYTSSATVREAIDMVCKLFKIPTCNLKMPAEMGKKRECLHAHIEQCIAPCKTPISKTEYRKLIFMACKFLEGDHEEIFEVLQAEMEKASERLEFERAALLRDKITAIKKLSERQKIISDKQADEDVIGFYRQDNKTFGEVLFIRRGRMIGRHSTVMDKTRDISDEDLCSEFIKQFYNETNDIPKIIYTCYESEEENLLSYWLSQKTGRKTTVKCPKRGEKKQLTEMACKNARQNAVDHLLKGSQKNIPKSLLELKEKLGLASLPKRIEAYDISHTAGNLPVGSMVVFSNGKPSRSQYRRFKIETAKGGDDAAAMTEVLYRRLKHAQEETLLTPPSAKPAFLPLPDIILLDGGKSQVKAVSEVLSMLDAEIPLFGMVKDDRHKTRALINAKFEELGMAKTSSSFQLISEIQEEVHRFAIEYHKKLRKKHSIGSVLEEIEGVGPQTRKKLLKHFKSIYVIRGASLEELQAVPEISPKIAEKIYNFFHETS